MDIAPAKFRALVRASMLPRAVVALYLDAMTETGPKVGPTRAEVRKADILADFHAWAERNGYTLKLTLPAFGHHLLALRPSVIPRRFRTEDGRREWFYSGIKLNDY